MTGVESRVTLKARIDRIRVVHYSLGLRRRHAPAPQGGAGPPHVDARRGLGARQIMTAVTRRATGGTIRGLAAFLRLERKVSGNASAVASASEAGEGAQIVWEHGAGDLDMYFTPDGHGVSLRKVLEAETRSRASRPRRQGSLVTRNHIDSCTCMHWHGRKAPSRSADKHTSRIAKKALGDKFCQGTRIQSQKTQAAPRPENASQTTVLRGCKWDDVVRASETALGEGAVVTAWSVS